MPANAVAPTLLLGTSDPLLTGASAKRNLLAYVLIMPYYALLALIRHL